MLDAVEQSKPIVSLPDLTPEQALEALEAEVRAEGEDYVYQPVGRHESCQYAYRGQPSCLVGRALHRLGVPKVRLVLLDGFAETITDHVEHGRVNMPDDAASVLRQAQFEQDSGATWGEALTSAREALDNG